MAPRFRYGVMGAGAVSASLIGRLHSKASELGPVAAVSFRVASRIANTLRAGFAAREADEFNDVPAVLFHSPPDHAGSLLQLLDEATIEWQGKALVFCDCSADAGFRERFRKKGASTAVVRELGISRRLIVEADPGASLQLAHRLAHDLQMKAIEIEPGSGRRFDAAMTMGTAAITALIDRAADLLSEAGIRDTEAARIASAVFEQTAKDYAHSGKQSWSWYARRPPVEGLEEEIAAAGPVLRELLLFAFETFGKHPDVGKDLERGPDPERSSCED